MGREVWKNVPRVSFFLPRYVFKKGGKRTNVPKSVVTYAPEMHRAPV